MAGIIKRGSVYHIQWYDGKTKRRKSLKTDSLQIAKERLRQFESAKLRGVDNPLPSRTPVPEVVAAYIKHMQAHRPEKSWRKDLTHLREAFGPCCPELELTSSRARKGRAQRCPTDRRKTLRPIEVGYFEEITTAGISEFIADRVRARGLKPKTANRYREVVAKVIRWAMDTEMVRMPMDRNPAAKVARYRDAAPVIEYLSLAQIDAQLDALNANPRLRVMVGTLIFAGLRREELLWLQADDLAPPSEHSAHGLIRVRAKTMVNGRWQPKTGRNRAVPVSSRLWALLDTWTQPASDHSWLFPSPQGKRWDADNFSQTLARTNKAAGLPWTCLHYRHTFGSQLAQTGISLFQISAMMGNSPEICRRHYAAVVPEMLGTAVEFSRG